MKRLIRWALGYCEQCQRYFTYPKRRRMNTMYQDEEKNYSKVCLNCFNHNEECWEEMWNDYYSSRL